MNRAQAAKSIAIVGAGPAGCCLATLCARRGHQVTVFEAHEEPRPVVGESLLPFGNRVLSLLGMKMDGFVEKKGALFVCGERRVRYSFTDAERPTWTTAHQVPRADFDARLRALAKQAGATFKWEEVEAAPEGFDWVVDASGRRRVLGRKWTSYQGHGSLRNAAQAGHVKALLVPEGSAPGDITIYALDGAWFWIIPLADDLTSIGLVKTPARLGLKFQDALLECPELAALLREVPPIEKLHGYQDFTEYAQQFCGDGWALVGDAALFLDPIFSSGVLFSLEGAERLAQVIDGEMTPEKYEETLRRAASRIETLIVGFYSGDFFDLGFLKESAQAQPFRAGVVSLLAGDVFGKEARMANVVARRLPDVARLAREAESDS